MIKKRILIAGQSSVLRQFLVESLCKDPQISVVCVELLTQAVAAETDLKSGRRCKSFRVNASHGEKLVDILNACAPHTIINLMDTDESEISTTGFRSDQLLAAVQQIWTPLKSAEHRLIHLAAGKLTSTSRRLTTLNVPRCSDASARAALAEQRSRHYGVPTCIVSAEEIFGCCKPFDTFVSSTIKALRRQMVMKLSGEKRNWVNVEDVADAIAYVSRHGLTGNHYCVAYADGRRSQLALAELICDQLDQLVPARQGSFRERLPAPSAFGEDGNNLNVTRPQQCSDIGWKPIHDFHCALAAAVRSSLEQMDQTKPSSARSLHYAAIA